MVRKAALKFLGIYQKFFTLLGFGSCRFYPTCSEYAKWQFQKNNIFKAFWFSTLRILRCNQLFIGGIDYPIVKKNLNCNKVCTYNDNKNSFIVEFWLVPKEGDKYYLVKTFDISSNPRKKI
ncbi:MAG TPA: membrane protein insertion efficiency factor YidD [Campylobacterales bacterium]|nr:membrane protein insertion efficiency factor YidD [Campylobacterales bacterium]HIP59062.1 membrane protein insertion efficiency factor YidD [Campylobacterales bacterium]